jgi:voltage-gated potassium channel
MFMGLLSLLAIVNVILVILPIVNSDTKAVITSIDGFLTIFFLFDFLYRFFTVKSKSHYFFKNWGWADLLASLPFYGLRIFRIFRTIWIYNLSQNSGMKKVVTEFKDNRAQFAVYVVILAVILVLEIGASLILIFESQSPKGNIKTAGDALWWGYVTITTVGYGDFYPVTIGGRLVGVAVMATGISIIAVFTAFVANSFLSPKKKKKKEAALQPDDPKTKLAEIKRMLDEEEKVHADFKARIEERIEEMEGMLGG